MAPIKLFQINCNGLRGQKRPKVFKMLKNADFDICMLNETYITQDVENQWKSEWGNYMFFNYAKTTHSQGEMILLSKKFGNSVSDVKKCFSTTRSLGISFKLDNRQFLVVSCYGPHGTQKRFYQDLQNSILDAEIENVIVSGDFNCTLTERDNITGNRHNSADVNAFNAFLENCELLDTFRLVHGDKQQFTFKRRNCSRRIDYTFVSANLATFVKNSKINYFPYSDHYGTETEIKFGPSFGSAYWKFNDSLLNDELFMTTTRKIIKQNLSAQDNAKMILELTKSEIKSYAIFRAKQLKNAKSQLKTSLNDELTRLHAEYAKTKSNQVFERIYEIEAKLDELERETSFGAILRSRVKHFTENERNTKYFLKMEQYNGGKKVITKLITENGVTTENKTEIKKEIEKYFSTLYGVENAFNDVLYENFTKSVKLPQLNEIEAKSISKPVNNAELLETLGTMNKTTSPGIDGFTVKFYIALWDELGDLITATFNECFQDGELSNVQKIGVLTLLHKGKDLNRHELKNYRSINVSTVEYRLISKTLVLRLKKHLNKLICPDQAGFVPGRQAGDIIRSIQDTINKIDFHGENGILAAFDFEKAFDRLNRRFMLKALQKYNLDENFLKWVQLLYKNSKGTVNYNGELTSLFPIETGVKQGCPLSPILFILCLEVLFEKLRSTKCIKGIKIKNREAKIFGFADDTTMILNDELSLVRAIKMFEIFSKFSNLKINFNKTEAMWLGAWKCRKKEICKINWKCGYGCQIKILGIFISNTRQIEDVNQNFEKCILRCVNIVKGWYFRNLTLLGRILLIKTFLLTQFTYLMSCSHLTEKQLERVNSLLFKVLWVKKFANFDENVRVVHKVSKEQIIQDYEHGGLKMVDIRHIQAKMLLKRFLRFKTPENAIWKTLMENNFFDITTLENAFTAVRKLNLGIKSKYYKELISTWVETVNLSNRNENQNLDAIWLNDLFLCQKRPLYFKEWIKIKIYSIGQFFDQNGAFWSYEHFLTLGLPNTALNKMHYLVLKSVLNKFKIISSDSQTELTLNGKKIQNVKKRLISAFYDDLHHKHFETKLGFPIWNLPQKLKMSTEIVEMNFKILQNIFPCGEKLFKWNIKQTDKCEACSEIDTIWHYFYECSCLEAFWQHFVKNMRNMGKKVFLDRETAIYGVSDKSQQELNIHLFLARLAIKKTKKVKNVNCVNMYDDFVQMFVCL